MICTSCKEKNDSKKNSYCTVFPGAPGKPCGPVGPLSPCDKLKQIMKCIQSHIGKGLDGVVHKVHKNVENAIKHFTIATHHKWWT